jgi:hypothetical protein
MKVWWLGFGPLVLGSELVYSVAVRLVIWGERVFGDGADPDGGQGVGPLGF